MSESRHQTNLDLSVLRTYASRSLTDQLDGLLGPKTLIIDPALSGPLGLVTDVTNLKDHGVDKLFWLEPAPLGPAVLRNVVWVCRPSLRAMALVADQVLALPPGAAHACTVFMAPRATQVCRNALSDAGVLGSLDIREFDLGLVALEKDLLSLEEDHAGYPQTYADGDLGPNFNMAKAVMTIQRAFGLIPRMIGKGTASKKLVNLLHRLRSEYVMDPAHGTTIPKLNVGSIDTMIILDRQVDMVTPMCTQLTYEGLLDEIFTIKHAHIEVTPDLLAPSTPVAGNTAHSIPSSSTSQNFPQNIQKKKHLLTSKSDGLFSELRDKNFAFVGSSLNRIAKRINFDYERRNEARTVKQIREFVGKLPGLQNEHQALRLHTGLSEQIMTITNSDEFNVTLEIQQNLVAGLDLSTQEKSITQLIDQEAPLPTILRLLCLYSITTGGLKPKTLETFKRDILQTYGYQHLPLLLKLSTLNLLTTTSSTHKKPNFNTVRKVFKLIVDDDDVDENEPPFDISYTFSGYAPLSIRIIQSVLNDSYDSSDFLSGWKNEEVLRGFEGDIFDEYQSHEPSQSREDLHSSKTTPKTCIICFLGGITFSEISALRLTFSKFNQIKYPNGSGGGGRRLLVLTTGLVTGNSILNSLMPVETRI